MLELASVTSENLEALMRNSLSNERAAWAQQPGARRVFQDVFEKHLETLSPELSTSGAEDLYILALMLWNMGAWEDEQSARNFWRRQSGKISKEAYAVIAEVLDSQS